MTTTQRAMTPKSLDALKQENLPACQLEDFFTTATAKDEEGERLLGIIREYLSSFLPPSKTCVKCGMSLDGFFGSFRWGMVSGEGFCGECGYPARAIHRFRDPQEGPDAEPFAELSGKILQYHPSALSDKPPVAENATTGETA